MSANAEDITIYDAFFSGAEFRGGNHTYMEIGAHDRVRESNSRFFDVCLGWNGLLVEPHPKNYERTVHLRPNAIHLGIALRVWQMKVVQYFFLSTCTQVQKSMRMAAL